MLPTRKCFDVAFRASLLLDVHLFLKRGWAHKNCGASQCTRNVSNTAMFSTFKNKMKNKLKRCIFISSSQRDTGSQGCFKNKWMLNNVFDVLYLNLYGYLHYSFFPGLGTNPIDMEMGCSVSWQCGVGVGGCRECSQVYSYSKCAENRFLESVWLHGIGYTGLHKPLRARQWASLFNQQKKSFMLDTFSTLKRLIRSKWSQYWDWRIMTLEHEMFYLLHLRQGQEVLFW